MICDGSSPYLGGVLSLRQANDAHAPGQESSMKLVVAVVQNGDADALFRRLAEAGIGATRIGSSGGYLRHANATVFIGVEEDRLAVCLDLLKSTCGRRMHRAPAWAAEIGEIDLASVTPTEQGGGIYMVFPVDRFVRIERAIVAGQTA